MDAVKVAILSQPFDLVLPPEQTSVGLWTHEVARRLAADCDPTIIARRGRGAPRQVSGDWGRLELVPALPLRVWTQASRLWARVTPPPQALFGQPFYAGDYLLAAMRRLRRVDPDVIHIQNFPHFAPPLRRAFPRSAIVLHMHCDWLAELPMRRTARNLAAVDTVMGCSEHVAGAAARRFGGAPARFAVVPNGAPSPPVAPGIDRDRRDGPRVVFVGRVSPEKGVHTLLSAWGRVVAVHPSARLDIVGPPAVTPREFLIDLSPDPRVRALARFYPPGPAPQGGYHAALLDMIAPEIAASVTFVGHEPHPQVIARVAGASVLANPSLSEAFGMSLVEALSVGTPVVATRVGGMPDILTATGGGLLVGPDDPEALAGALIALLSDPARARALGRRGAERVRSLYAWDRIAGLTLDLYREAVVRRRARPATGTGKGAAPAGYAGLR
jgi:glycosyltransferase involved in cell wall biosynthesis